MFRRCLKLVGTLALTVSAYSGAEAAAGLPYQLIFDGLSQLAERHPGWATVVDYGYTPGGRGLRAIKLQDPSFEGAPREGRPAALITGATHGDEFLGLEDRLAVWLVEQGRQRPGVRRWFAAGGVVYVVPVVNPDGYERDKRENNNAADLNRDFDLLPEGAAGFREQETRALATWLEQELYQSNAKLKITVDYHCCDGSLLYPWSYTDNELPAEVIEAHARIGKLMQADIDPTYTVGPTNKILGYHGKGTSKDYYFAKYGALAFTYEAKTRAEGAKFARHALWWEHIFQTLSE